MNLHERCALYRAEGVPIHVRIYDTPLKRVGIWIYYGYAPAIAHCKTVDEAETVIKAVARVHSELLDDVRAGRVAA